MLFTLFSHAENNTFLPFVKGAKGDATPQRQVNNANSKVGVNYQFIGATVSKASSMGQNFNYLHIPGFANQGAVGKPCLPSHIDMIACKPGSKMTVKITSAEYTEYSGYYIHPALRPATDRHGDPEPEFTIDTKTYSTNAFYPSNIVELAYTQKLRGMPIAFVNITPVQFNPITKTIRVYHDVKYELVMEGGNADFDILNVSTKHFENYAKGLVINPEMIKTSKNRVNTNAVKNYIIITHSEYKAAADSLAQWKSQLGYGVEVVSKSSWTAAEVKSAVHTRYQSWNPKPDYVVIIGDHTGTFKVPGEIFNTPDNDGSFASDNYFVCIDGANDYVPDMAHGRISVSSATEAMTVVKKIINYEKNPLVDANFYKSALHCAMFQDDNNDKYADRRFSLTSENIRDYVKGLKNYQFNIKRIYKCGTSVTPLYWNNGIYAAGEPLPDELKKPKLPWTGGKIQIKDSINAGQLYVLHRDHGYSGGTGWADPEYLTSDIPNLSNGNKLPIVFSINCHTGEFQLAECFAEKFLRHANGGAVGVVGATYYSLSGWNDALTIGMFDAIWPGFTQNFTGSGGIHPTPVFAAHDSILTMGDVVNHGLSRMVTTWGGQQSYTKYEHELFMYFGDPAMKMWTKNPHDRVLTATHANSVNYADTFIVIKNINQPNCVVTLSTNGILLGKAISTGDSAKVYFSIDDAASEVIVTVSKDNCKPYYKSLTVQGTAVFKPLVATAHSDNLTQTSATCYGTVLNTGGSDITACGILFGSTPALEIGAPGVTLLSSTPVNSGNYSCNIISLSAATTYYYRAYATNNIGTRLGDVNSFTTNCGIYNSLPFSQSFSGSTVPTCWSNLDNQGSGQVWQFGTFSSGLSGATGNYAYLNSDGYGSGNSQNADLVTPTIDLSAYNNVNVSFKHYFKEYNGSNGKFSYSLDNGATWTQVFTITTSNTNPTNFTQAIPALNGKSQVKLKWNYTGSYGYYWCIDELQITGTLSGPTVPAATTSSATNIAATSVQLNADVNPGNDTAYVKFFYGTSTNYTDSIASTVNPVIGASLQNVSAIVNGLQQGTTYHFKVKVSNKQGIALGNDMTFTTTVAVTGVTLSNDSLELFLSNPTPTVISANVTPNNATVKTITWQSTASNVASVNNGSVTPLAVGNTFIIATTTQGGFKDTCFVKVDLDNKTSFVAKSKDIVIYPNPNKGEFYFSAKTNEKNLNFEIIDVNGKTVHTQVLSSDNGDYNHVIQLENINKGVYMIKFTGKSTVLLHKLVIQ